MRILKESMLSTVLGFPHYLFVDIGLRFFPRVAATMSSRQVVVKILRYSTSDIIP